MKKIFTLILLLLSVCASASHIVGGEFQIIHLSEYQYRINLLIYFDDLNGNPGSRDSVINAKIFRNSDNAFIRTVPMGMLSMERLSYTQPECTINSFVVTSRIVYTTIQTLDPGVFNDPGGYYVVWERCCRNYNITNIQSNDPGISPLAAGQTFFLQFPPVVKDGALFINSSPQLFPPLLDYGCVGRTFYADFAGLDSDGDSLVYSITTPLSTHTFDAIPAILPKPYPEIVWRAPFSAQNSMNGNPDLRISSRGLLTVQPSTQGLFAFAVKCEEYRHGVKIGEVRREYQILARDCAADAAPDISAQNSNGSYTNSPLNVHFGNTVSDADRCVVVKVTDADISGAQPENIRIRAVPIGFIGDVSAILPATVTASLSQQNPFAEFLICFDRCPPTESSTFQIGIIAYDDACSVPLTDTVRINVSIDIAGAGCLYQSINFPAISDKLFGDAPFALNATTSSGLQVTYSSSDITIASLSSSLLTMHKSGPVVITATQPGNENYKIAPPVDRKFCINPQPPVITIAADGSSIAILSSSQTGNAWYKDGVLQSDLTGNSIQVSDEAMNYTARVIIGGCASEESNSILITGIDEMSLGEATQIFPSPTSDILEIHLPGNERTKIIELYDMKGQRLFQNEISAESHFINMEGWDAGVYMLKIQHEKRFYVRKILKK